MLRSTSWALRLFRSASPLGCRGSFCFAPYVLNLYALLRLLLELLYTPLHLLGAEASPCSTPPPFLLSLSFHHEVPSFPSIFYLGQMHGNANSVPSKTCREQDHRIHSNSTAPISQKTQQKISLANKRKNLKHPS